MSFLGNIVNSIGTDKAPPPPPKPPSRPASANAIKQSPAAPKPGPRPPLHQTSSSLGGTKRKAEEASVNTNGKVSKPNSIASAGSENRKGPSPPLNTPKQQLEKNSTVPKLETNKASTLPPANPPSIQATTSLASATKPPPSKGSYADLMARAKQSAEQRSQTQVGVIKHQTTTKEKTSKLAERRKEEQEKAKAQKAGLSKAVKPESRRSISPEKKAEHREPNPSKLAQKPSYKGTMGTSTSRARPYQSGAKKSRYDEYLGTDEEEDSDLVDEEEGNYDSEGSSDMEARFDDVEGEERQALRTAKEDDARELALQNQLKREKEERRRKLMSLASKRK